MKKTFTILLAILLLLATACGNPQSQTNNVSKEKETNMPAGTVTDSMIYCAQTLNPTVGHIEEKSFIGTSTLIREVVLSASDFKALFTEKDVTADNFYDCFSVDSFKVYDDTDTVNEWGEITKKATGEVKEFFYVFLPKSLMLNGLFDLKLDTPEVGLPFQSPQEDGVYTVKQSAVLLPISPENFDAPIEFEIVRARGKFYDCNIPEDIWNIDNHGNRYLAVDTTEIYPNVGTYNKYLYLYEKGMVHATRAEEWGEYYLHDLTNYMGLHQYEYNNPSALWGDTSMENLGNDFFHRLFLDEPGDIGG